MFVNTNSLRIPTEIDSLRLGSTDFHVELWVKYLKDECDGYETITIDEIEVGRVRVWYGDEEACDIEPDVKLLNSIHAKACETLELSKEYDTKKYFDQWV